MVGKCCCIVIGLISGVLAFTFISLLVYFLAIAKALPKVLIHYEVTNASLTKFNLTANNTFLDYNLTLNLALENPGSLDYDFDRLDAVPVFKDQTVNDMTSLSKPFYLQHEANVTFQALFSGNHSVNLVAQDAFHSGNDAVDIVLKIRSEFSAKVGNKKTTLKEEVACGLKFPLNSNGTNTGTASSQITKCVKTGLDANID